MSTRYQIQDARTGRVYDTGTFFSRIGRLAWWCRWREKIPGERLRLVRSDSRHFKAPSW